MVSILLLITPSLIVNLSNPFPLYTITNSVDEQQLELGEKSLIEIMPTPGSTVKMAVAWLQQATQQFYPTGVLASPVEISRSNNHK